MATTDSAHDRAGEYFMRDADMGGIHAELAAEFDEVADEARAARDIELRAVPVEVLVDAMQVGFGGPVGPPWSERDKYACECVRAALLGARKVSP